MTKHGVDEEGYRALVYLGGLTDAQIRHDLSVLREVIRARAHGATWASIGISMGISAQAAHARFMTEDRDALEEREQRLSETSSQKTCQCPDDRCAGYHHDADEECSCTNPV